MVDLSKLHKGDVIRVATGGRYADLRVVVRVVDLDGALGGLVDTRPMPGRGGYSRSAGFRAGNDVLAVVACTHGKDLVTVQRG